MLGWKTFCNKANVERKPGKHTLCTLQLIADDKQVWCMWQLPGRAGWLADSEQVCADRQGKPGDFTWGFTRQQGPADPEDGTRAPRDELRKKVRNCTACVHSWIDEIMSTSVPMQVRQTQKHSVEMLYWLQVFPCMCYPVPFLIYHVP